MKTQYERDLGLKTVQEPVADFSCLIEKYERPITVLIVGTTDRVALRRLFKSRNQDDVLIFVEYEQGEQSRENDEPAFEREIRLRPESLEDSLKHLARFEHLDIAWLSPAIAHRWFGSATSVNSSLAEQIIGPVHDGDAELNIELLAGSWPARATEYREIESRHAKITGGRIGIEIGLASKVYVHPERTERRPWLAGISLNTFLEFGGCWPTRLTLLSLLENMNFQKPHGDLEPWNVVLDGRRLEPIDRHDERGLEDALQVQNIAASICRIEGYSVYDLPLLVPDALRQSFALVVWPPAEERFTDIRSSIESQYQVTFSGSFEMSKSGWQAFLDVLYRNVVPDSTAVAKRDMLGQLPHRLHLIAFLIPGEEFEIPGPSNGPPHVASGLVSNRYPEINRLKEAIRECVLDDLDWDMAGLSNNDTGIGQFAVNHAADSLRQSRELFQAVVRYSSRARSPSPIRYFGRFVDFLGRHRIDLNTVAIVDSAILAMLGLRINRDLDFIVDPTAKIFQQLEQGAIQVPSGLHWVRDWSMNQEIPDHLLLYSSRLYQFHHGIKVCRLEPLYFNKRAMGRPKDLADLEKIDSIRDMVGWDHQVFDFFANGKPVTTTEGRTQLRTLPDVEKIIYRARTEGRALKRRELKRIPRGYWSLEIRPGERLIPDKLFPDGERTKQVWFEHGYNAKHVQENRLELCRTSKSDPLAETLSACQLASISRQDVENLLREKMVVVLHFHNPDEAAYSTLRYFLEVGFFSPERIVATVGGTGAEDFRCACLKLSPALRFLHLEQVLSYLDWFALQEKAGIRPKDENENWLQGKGLTDWCTAIAIAILGLEPEYVMYSDTDLHLVNRYDPAFHLGAALLHCTAREIRPCRVVPACSGRNNELVVAAIHNLIGQASASSAFGDGKYTSKLQDYHQILSSQVWPIAGEHVLLFRIGDRSPVLDMPYPTGYGIEMFISCFLADCARRAGQKSYIAQPEILFPRIDHLNDDKKEISILHLMAVFIGLITEHPKRILEFDLDDLKVLNRSILPGLGHLHMIAPKENTKVLLPFAPGQILPAPRLVLEEGWVDGEAVLEHLDS